MKQLKNSLKVVLLFALLLTVAGCEPPEEPVMRKRLITFNTQIPFNTTAYIWNQMEFVNDFDANDLIRTHLNGNGVSYADKFAKFEIELSHITVRNTMKRTLHLQEGKFEIFGDGCSIYGTYLGRNTTSGKEKPQEILFNIEGGNGFYTGAFGYLIGWRDVDLPYPNSYAMGIRGMIQRKPDTLDESQNIN